MVSSMAYTHSKDVSGINSDPFIFDCEIGNELVKTTSSWIDFARQTLEMLDIAYHVGDITDVKFYGENLCMKLWDGVWRSEEDVRAHELKKFPEKDKEGEING